ncbi:thiamine pyrophosphate-binding protein [Mycobacterium sp. 21AC1]|uniref:thiamine pyrophosphate-binding protein n=1 Tax=[Mycobacterium] appelbergii TaxID=2939269 RepID=UPI00293950FC|nr:thiamine pyrophosphate-binding protein [Mycobacterium sp. 21AC1]MDV3126057.1 thiamine pyrophosphate-binding protein [Mycobacterium sp. 21AC1]
MKVYEQVAVMLADHGVHTMFGLLGDANMYLASAFETAGGRFVRATHEAGAVSMADGYARMTGHWAVATVTHGPGFTNALTALVEAARFSTPVLLITGDTPAEPTHMQRLDIAAVCASLGVVHERVHRPDTVARDLGRAVRRLESSWAPVVLNVSVPISLMDRATEDISASGALSWAAPVQQIDDDALDMALGLAASAARPVVVAGRGVIAAGAEAAVTGLADALGAGLFTTGLGIGLFAGHPRHLGIMGGIAHEEATSILMNSDCVIAVGTSLNKYTSHGGEILAAKSVIHIDDDPVKLGWFVTPTCGIVGDARTVTETMAEAIRDGDLQDKTTWKRLCQTASTAMRQWTPTDDRTASDTVDIRVASQRLDAILPEGCAVVSDVGRFIAGSWPYLTKPGPGRFTAMTGFGAIGLGVAGGTGAAVGAVSDVTVVLVGDGGFMMNASELATAVREKLPLLVVVYNDGAYGAEYQKLVNEGFSAQHSYNEWPDIAATATGLGTRALTVRKLEDFEAVAEAVDHLAGPLVVDVRLDPTHHLEF